MHKFICDLCDGNCELTINVCDMEDQMPFRCPSSDMEARFIIQPPEQGDARDAESVLCPKCEKPILMGVCELGCGYIDTRDL